MCAVNFPPNLLGVASAPNLHSWEPSLSGEDVNNGEERREAEIQVDAGRREGGVGVCFRVDS